MKDKLFHRLEDLNVNETDLLLDKEMNIKMNLAVRKRIEKSVMKKTGYYNERSKITNKISELLGGLFMKRKIALALSTGLMLTLAGGGYAYAKTPVGYVSMDINPSVELGVNAFDKVVSVEAYNEDGEKILEGTDLINYNIENAVETIISNAITEGFIDEDGSSAIEITTSTDKEGVAEELEAIVEGTVDETLENNDLDADVETENVALARRNEARELGITPGKLNLIQKLQALDSEITVDEYKDSSVKDIQKKTKELRKINKVKVDEATTDISENTDAVVEENNDDAAVTETKTDSNNNGNGAAKKEENSNGNAVKEDKAADTTEKQNNNSAKVEKTSDEDSKSKDETVKSSDKETNKSSSQDKGKNKNN